jgi:anti-sigma B factor antagonist
VIDINVKSVGQVMVVQLAGRIDGRTAPQVQERVWPLIQPRCAIIVDATHLAYMSSAGLRLLATAQHRASDQEGSLVLAGLSERVRDTMSITGFLPLFTTYETVAAALAAQS